MPFFLVLLCLFVFNSVPLVIFESLCGHFSSFCVCFCVSMLAFLHLLFA